MSHNFVKAASVILFCFTLFAHANASADPERILNFDSVIVVNKDASIDVTENISVYANQDKIIHGIVRRLPTRHKDSYGISHDTHYTITRILMNKHISPYHFVVSMNQLAIYIGQKDETLNPGIYNYTIQYHVNYAVNFLTDVDELYWNITGNEWDFPIRKASANIILPDGAVIQHYTGYTGFKGDTQQDLTIDQKAPNQISFTTTETLLPNQGLTVAVSWQKGIIVQPDLTDIIIYEFSLYKGQIILAQIAALSFLYYFVAWYWKGRDKRRGTIIPLFEPPENLSPAAVRYISRMGYDEKTLTASIVSIATKGGLTIKNENNEFILSESDKGEKLTDDEVIVKTELFKKGSVIQLFSENWKTISNTQKQLKNNLKNRFKNVYFETNAKYLIPGWCLTALAFIIALFTVEDAGDALPAMFTFFFWLFICYFFFTKFLTSAWQAKTYASFKTISKAVFSFLITFIFIIIAIGVIIASFDIITLSLLPSLFILIVLNLIFYQLLKSPTPQGRLIMDQIDGFKLFLSTTERYRLDQFNPPQKTPELFEKYLPYAIALDVESAWGEQFNDVLKAAGTEKEPYHPVWYSGTTSWNTSTPAAFPSVLSSSLMGVVAVSSASSASSGGGSSGGGGGGGGGGGW